MGFLYRIFLISIVVSSGMAGIPSDSQAELDITQLDHTNSPNEFFKVALGSGYAFWSHYSKGIFMWKATDPTDIVQRIANDDDVLILSASGNKLAWIDDSNDIQLWDGNSTQEVEDDVIDTISLYGDNIAFVEKDTEDFLREDSEIFLRTPGKKLQVSNNNYDDLQPSVFENRVAWVGKHDDNYDLFYWDGQHLNKLTDSDGDDLTPSLDHGAIAWTEWDGEDFEIMYWAGGQNIYITDDNEDDIGPILKDGSIVWIKADGQCEDIYHWDGTNITRLTDRCYENINSLDFNGKAILWSAKDGSGRGVYYAELSNTPRGFTGWWYDPNEPGTGLATEVKDGKIYLAWFVFDGIGRTTWYSAGGKMTDKDNFSGDLYSWTGWTWGETYFPPSSSVIGTIVVHFSNTPSDTVTFSTLLNGQVITKTFHPFMADFAPGPEDPRHITGWWYDPSYNGMGFFLDARGGEMALAWYNYREDHSARWWTSHNMLAEGATVYLGNLDDWTGGPCATCPYNGQPTISAGAGGTISIEFQDANHADVIAGNVTMHLERFEVP